MIKMQEIKNKSDQELIALVAEARDIVRQERFKDKFSRKASIVRSAKTEIARALTELSARRRNVNTK